MVESVTEKIKTKEKVRVRLHQRKIKGQVSEEVKEMARREGIVLKEGHTLVREHKRTMERVRYKVNRDTPTVRKAYLEKKGMENKIIGLDWE